MGLCTVAYGSRCLPVVSQEKAEEMAKEQGFKLGISKTSFKGNSKVRA